MPARPAEGRGRLTILLVEDDPGDVVLAEEALRDGTVPARLIVVRNADAALEHLAGDARPDLVLLDLNLPRMSGHELLAAMKADARLRAIPVVVLSTSAMPEDVRRSYELGASAHVVKPVDFERFASVVHEIENFFLRVAVLP